MNKAVETTKKRMCTGCCACGYICPVGAVSFCNDEEGFKTPVIDPESCINCGKCKDFCNMQNEKDSEIISEINETYAVKLKDDKQRMRSRSGGAFVALSDAVIERNGVVIGAYMDDRFRVYHKCAHTKEERDLLCGSKYVQSDTESIYKTIKELLDANIDVLFCGSPCQVAAVSLVFPRKHYRNLFLCDFVCHGVPSPQLWLDYISWLNQKYGELSKVEFRDKEKYTWESHVQRVATHKKVFWSKRYTNLFASSICLRESCYCCPYTTRNRVSDFTLGDYWGIDEIADQFNDGKGISLLMIRSNKGKELFFSQKDTYDYLDTSDMELTHYNLKRPTCRPAKRDSFRLDYVEKGFEYVSKKYGKYDLIHQIKYRVIDHME